MNRISIYRSGRPERQASRRQAHGLQQVQIAKPPSRPASPADQANTVLKEVRFRLKIDAHNYDQGRPRQALPLRGGRVKAMIQFRGREQRRPEMGVRLLDGWRTSVAEVGAVGARPRGRSQTWSWSSAPSSRAEARAEAREQQQREARGQPAQAARRPLRRDGDPSMGTRSPRSCATASAPPGQTVESARWLRRTRSRPRWRRPPTAEPRSSQRSRGGVR
ncbi:hypothetical protein QJS66_06395 [Kocuria rhizophila]|nr:hypothetical protein QJS66_06395 [Kocuria rhizophila]